MRDGGTDRVVIFERVIHRSWRPCQRRVQEMNALAKAGTETETTAKSSPENEPSTKDEEDEAVAPSPQTSPYSDHRPALIALIGSMTPAGFEVFCSELLARVGVEDV
jgi:restriction system protein